MRRLYRAVCDWLEADAATKRPQGGEEPHPRGDVYAMAEHAHSFTAAPELHAGVRPTSIDNDDGGAYRLGFQPNEQRGRHG